MAFLHLKWSPGQPEWHIPQLLAQEGEGLLANLGFVQPYLQSNTEVHPDSAAKYFFTQLFLFLAGISVTF